MENHRADLYNTILSKSANFGMLITRFFKKNNYIPLPKKASEEQFLKTKSGEVPQLIAK
jgi:hypothetical protein